MPEYAASLLFVLFITVILHKVSRVKVYTSWRHAIGTNALCLFLATIWDTTALSRGHWSIGESFLLGPKIGIIPIEEYAFTMIGVYFTLVIFRIFDKQSGGKG